MLRNNFTGFGRIANDLELRKISNENDIVYFSVAVDRGGENKEVDFIDCCLFGSKAQAIVNNANKGSIILFNGRLQTQLKEYKGIKIKSTQVVVNEFQLFSGFGSEKEKNQEELDFSAFASIMEEAD